MNEDKLNKSFLTEEAKSDINEMLGNNESGDGESGLIGNLVKIITKHISIGTVNSGLSDNSIQPQMSVPTLKPSTLYTVIFIASPSTNGAIVNGRPIRTTISTDNSGNIPQGFLDGISVHFTIYAETALNNYYIDVALYIFEGGLM